LMICFTPFQFSYSFPAAFHFTRLLTLNLSEGIPTNKFTIYIKFYECEIIMFYW
jgi:hypothetical protein